MTQELFQRYLDNNCSVTEREEVELWLFSPQEQIDLLLRERWNAAHEPMPVEIGQGLWNRLKGIILSRKRGKVIPLFLSRQKRVIAAASVLLLMGLLTWYWYSSRWAVIGNNSSLAKAVVLPDGSTVWLNAWSSLQYSPDFNKEKREVKIKGEGYFIVKEDKAHPFIVYTNRIATSVLGTEFNVEAYPGESSVKVSLNKGKVSVSLVKNGSTLFAPVKVLQPGQMLSCAADQQVNVQPIAVKKVQAWTEGHFVVNDLDLASIIERMESKYGIRFHYVDDALRASCQHIAATFSQESWQQIVRQICFSCHLRCEIKGNDVFLDYSLQ